MMSTLNPRIDYQHVLRELSVNRANPCEVIRELVSNSYDASASRIWYFPLLQHSGFLFVDNGTGLSEEPTAKDISPYVAFFSIGTSTKQFGTMVGYKCQGSKLCFASSRVTIITRCAKDSDWATFTIENPAENLRQSFDISPSRTSTPGIALRESIDNPDERTQKILDVLTESWFKEHLQQGTCIVIQKFKTQNFEECFNPMFRIDPAVGKHTLEASYFYNYVRYNTKHGDTCHFIEEYGFPAASAKAIGQRCKPAEFFVWIGDRLSEIQYGFPYLPLRSSPGQQNSPQEVNALNQGTFQERFCKQIVYGDRKYAFILAIDGNRRRLNEYKTLGRRRNSASGIRLTDQCGVFISAQGVKCAPYNEILRTPVLQDFGCMADGDGQQHYTLFIDGTFPLVTNRNGLSEDAIRTLSDSNFLDKAKSFLNSCKSQGTIFRDLVNRLAGEKSSYRRDEQEEKIRATKEGIGRRERFIVDVGGNKISFVCPLRGEEHGVGALFCMLATIADTHRINIPDSIRSLWLRPLTFAGLGIDAIALPLGTSGLRSSSLRMLEYKYRFSPSDEFNHPFCATDHIVAWQIDECEENTKVSDSYQTSGIIKHINSIPPSLGYQITDIETDDGDVFNNTITVTSLRSLILKTFDTRIR